MPLWTRPRRPAGRRRRSLGPALGIAGFCLLAIVLAPLAAPTITMSVRGAGGIGPPAAENGTGGGSSNGYGLCSSDGPEALGVQWSCVAVLNLTELLLILGGIGIILWVFRDSDAAELPGDSSEVPLTEEDAELVRERRRARRGRAARPKGPLEEPP